jgi:manganese/zinc/iron transport system permease protein
MIEYNTLVVVCGASLLGAAAGVVGSFAVLRRRALAGDALAHASLPGICLAFLLFERRELYLLLAGALASGLLGVLVVSLLGRWTRTREDAAIGVVLSVFFGVGIVLSRIVQNRSSAGSKAGLDSFLLGKTSGMIVEDVVFLAAAGAASVFAVWLVFKELKATTFDPGFAQSLGWPVVGLDVLLLGLIAATVMIGLPAVGVVLISSLLILPAAAARFWTDRFERVVALAALLGAGVGAAGALLSARLERAPAGAVIVLTGSAVFIVSMLFAPKRGVLARTIADRRFADGLAMEAILRELFEAWESTGEAALIAEPSGPARKRGVRLLKSRGWIHRVGDRWTPTPQGLKEGRRAAAAHRLWRKLVHDHPDAAAAAELGAASIEELLGPELVRELALKLSAEGRWPAGEPIPSGDPQR